MAYKHGVYVTEQATSLTVPTPATAGLQVVFGTAPVNLAADPYKATNVPLLCYSYAEAAAAVGYDEDFASYTLCQSISANFSVVGAAPIVLVNVLDPKMHTKAVAATTVQVNAHTATLEQKGVLADTVKVQDGTKATAYQAGTDYLLTFDSNGYLMVTLLPGGAAYAATTLTVSGTAIDPSKVTADEIIGGVDTNTGAETGLEVLRQVQPKLGMVPGVLLAPGFSTNANVAAALQAKCTGINGGFRAICVVDIDTTQTKKYTDVKAAKEAQGLSDVNCYAVWPMVKIGSKVYNLSALAAARMVALDAANGDVPYASPSNKSLPISGTVLADGTEVLMDREQGNVVNSYGVATAVNMAGWKLWGGRTAAYPANTDPKDCWIDSRRFFNWRANSIILSYASTVDDPTNPRLIENVEDSENMAGNGFVTAGYCAAYRCQYMANENSVAAVLSGKVVFHLWIAKYTPAEDMEFILEFDPAALETALVGVAG